MPVFTIETPTGRKLDIEAANEAGAIKGAQEWETQNPAKEPAPAKPFGEKLKNFLGNVTPEGPISGLIALTRLAGDASKGNVDLMTDQGINRAIPTVTEGSVAAAPSARARPMPSAPKLPDVPVAPTKRPPIGFAEAYPQHANFPPAAAGAYDHIPSAPPSAPSAAPTAPVAPAATPAPAEGGGLMGGLMKYGVPIAAEVLGTAHGMPGLATIGRLSASHLLSKLASPKEPAPSAASTAPLTSRFEGTPSVGDAAAPAATAKPPVEALQTLKSHPEPIVSPAPAEGNPALLAARAHAKLMNAQVPTPKQVPSTEIPMDVLANAQGVSKAMRATQQLRERSGFTSEAPAPPPDPNAQMTAGALQGAAGTPMTPGVARLTPEPVPAPVAAPPAPTALPRDVASQGKLLSSGMLKVAKMREAAAKAEATPIEKIIEKAKAPKEAPKPEGVTLDETLGAPKGTFTPTESDYAHMNLQDAARHIVEAQKAKGIKFWHAEDSYIKATAGRLGAKGVIASKVAKVVGVPELTLKSWVQGAKTRTDATALRDHLKSLANKSNHGVIDAAFKEGLKQGWSK